MLISSQQEHIHFQKVRSNPKHHEHIMIWATRKSS